MKVMMKKGQAAVEFLMTYGWAVLMLLTIVGAYFLTNEKITTLNILFAFMVLIVIIIGRKTKIQVS